MQAGSVSFPDSPWLAQLHLSHCLTVFSRWLYKAPAFSCCDGEGMISVFLKRVHPDHACNRRELPTGRILSGVFNDAARGVG